MTFPRHSMTTVIFHDFPGLEKIPFLNAMTFQDVCELWLRQQVKCHLVLKTFNPFSVSALPCIKQFLRVHLSWSQFLRLQLSLVMMTRWHLHQSQHIIISSSIIIIIIIIISIVIVIVIVSIIIIANSTEQLGRCVWDNPLFIIYYEHRTSVHTKEKISVQNLNFYRCSQLIQAKCK